MKLDSFYEALRRNLSRLQPDFNDSDWERFRDQVPLPAVPFWRTRWARAAAVLLALGVGAALVHFLYAGRQTQLEQRVQQLTRQRDSLLSSQPNRLGTSVPPDSGSAWEQTLPELREAPEPRQEAADEPATQSFDNWFNSVLSKKASSSTKPALRTTKRKVSAQARGSAHRSRVKGTQRPARPRVSVMAQQNLPAAEAFLTIERIRTPDLTPIPTLQVQLLPVNPPFLPTLSYEAVRYPSGSSPGSTSLPVPGP